MEKGGNSGAASLHSHQPIKIKYPTTLTWRIPKHFPLKESCSHLGVICLHSPTTYNLIIFIIEAYD